jgi:hypothetical protein
MDQLVWLRVTALLTFCALLVVAWRWIPVTALNPDESPAWTEPHRHAWYALPIVMLAFIALAGFGSQSTQALRNPSLGTALTAAAFVGVPLALAWFINRAVRRARPAA